MANEAVKLEQFNIFEKQFPKVIIVGNGISLSCLNKEHAINGATGIIESAAKENHCKYSPDDIKELPFPLQYLVVAKDDKKFKTIKDLGKKLSGEMFYEEADWHVARQMTLLDADAILTTNYSYELERSLDKDFLKHRNKYAKFTEMTVNKGRREGKYQIHSFYQFENVTEKPIRIWHIHGEAYNPSSIVLGHDMYGNLLSRYKEEITLCNNRYKRSTRTNSIRPYSWIDYFIFGNVYIIGFSVSENEYDLWWLLNRKKQEKLPHGNTYYFDRYVGNGRKRMLFDALDVKEVITGCDDYKDHYTESLSRIKNGELQ